MPQAAPTDIPNSKTIMTPSERRDPNYFPPLSIAVPLGIQHILAMFVSNVTPAIIIAGAAGFGFGTPGVADLIYMIQMSMLFAGVATLFQTVGAGPIGARLPIVQGTSFAFIPIMIPLVAGQGPSAMAAVMMGAFCGGLLHISLSFMVGKARVALPHLVTGLVVLMIGLSLLKVGIQYAAGGVGAIGTSGYGSLTSWALALIVIFATLGFKFFGTGLWSTASVLLGLLVGYGAALALGRVDFSTIGDASLFSLPQPFYFGVAFSTAAILGFCMMVLVSAIETVGDVSAIAKSGAGREVTDKELSGAVLADGVGTSLAALFGALPNSSFSQNVGLVAMTGVMSRHVVTIGALFLIFCGLIPKVGAMIITIPIEVLGGGVIIMFGMVAAAGISILSHVDWNQRNMLIFAVSMSVGLGLQLEPDALQHLPESLQVFMTTGVLPAAFLAIILNLTLPLLSEDHE